DFKSNLYTDIAHEFKTPLTLISGPIDQKLSEGDLSHFDHANFTMVKRNTRRLTSLVDQLLELAKLENGKVDLKISKGNLSLFVLTITKSFEYQARLKNIAFSVEIEPMCDVWYDEDVIEKITTNLLSNAFKYAPKNGICELLVERNEGHVRLIVINTITPGSKMETEKMFARFYQQDTFSEGVGVGLSLVKELVKVYGGTIDATIEEDDLIRFTVELPLERAAFPEQHIPETLAQSETIQENPDTSKTDDDFPEEDQQDLPILLVVEDHEEIRTFIKRALQKKYRILEAENGKIGMKVALCRIPDIILSDVRMPVQNGIEFCNALKMDERTSHIPIILLTASIGEDDELNGLVSGADDYIKKPFKISVLEQRLANQIAIRKTLRKRYSQEFILKPKDIAITPNDELFLNSIQLILDEHLTDSEFNSETFGKLAKMSRMQLHRKLLAYTGLSTSAFIRSERLKQALQVLQTSDLTICEVAYTVGFSTPTYFMKCFKKTFKKTPSEYLQSFDIQ
ncbi:MAG TPA: response regulator, partial [Pricia sp.]|nr:response regulator [Pricia sp.]